VEHVLPVQHGGTDEESNLAAACAHCNRRKGPNLAGIDPIDGSLAALFNPRTQVWEEHFEWAGDRITGTTSIGRVTVRVLNMNHPEQLRNRGILLE
jgi:hypothetical protein